MDELRAVESDYAALRVKLDRLNAEISALKAARRSVRDNYRLRDRQAEAEATAQRVTQVEAKIRALGGQVAGGQGIRTPVETPRATGEENPFEREAKADLLADQSARLLQEAARLTQASADLRGRQALRRQARKWDRDPFAAMESPKRNLTLSVSVGTTNKGSPVPDTGSSTQKPTAETPVLTTDSSGGSLGGTATTGTNGPTRGNDTTLTTAPATPGVTTAIPPSTIAGGSSAASSAKVSPTPLNSVTANRLEQRIFLDPATAAQLRQALGSDASLSDPEALARAAELLRARARALSKEEKSLRDGGPTR